MDFKKYFLKKLFLWITKKSTLLPRNCFLFKCFVLNNDMYYIGQIGVNIWLSEFWISLVENKSA